MSNFVFLHPEVLWVAPLLVLLVLVSTRLVRGLAPWRKRTATFLQSLVVLLLLASLAQPVLAHPHDDLSLAVVLDSSASTSAQSRQQAVQYAQGVLTTAKPGYNVIFIGAGRQAKQLTKEEITGGTWSSPADANGNTPADERATDLASGLRLAGSLLGESGRRRVVVVSDGWETQGHAADEAERLQAGGVDVQVVGLTALGKPEVIVRSLDLPPYARVGDSVQADLNVYSTQATSATLQLSADGRAIGSKQVSLQPGENSIPIDQTATDDGFHRLDATISSSADTSKQNNSASATLVVKAQPHVLVVEDREGEAAPLAAALRKGQMSVEVSPPSSIGSRLDQLDWYDGIVLTNVAATSLTLDQQRALQEYVRREGHGLVVTGGETSYTKGDYAESVLEDVLPVSSRPGPAPEKGPTTLILVFDRSASMDEWMGLSSQDTKFSMAKEAARLAIDSLRDGDTFGVLSFDTESSWTIDPVVIHPNTDRKALKDAITNIQLGGGTAIFDAVDAASNKIFSIKSPSKHIVLLTDGQDYHPGGWDDLIAKLRQNKVTLSTIGVGSDADKELLTDLAKKGQGRYYFTERLQNIPKIVFRELDLTFKQATIEGKVQPHVQDTSPVLRGIAPEDIPQLGGYDITVPKPDSVTALTSDMGHPLLSHWNYGLGRVVAFTSGSGPGWGADWMVWGDFDRFWNEAVRWTLAAPVNRQLRPSVTVRTDPTTGNNVAHISVESLTPDLDFSELASISAGLRSPSGVVTTTLLTQTAPGRYEADVPAGEQGAYEVRVSRDAPSDKDKTQETVGFSVPLGVEWANAGTNDRLLKRLNGGKPYLTTPTQALDTSTLPEEAKDYDPLWFYPLAAALVLLLASVAVRRVEFRRPRPRS